MFAAEEVGCKRITVQSYNRDVGEVLRRSFILLLLFLFLLLLLFTDISANVHFVTGCIIRNALDRRSRSRRRGVGRRRRG